VTGRHALVAWHAAHAVLVRMCAAFLPGALTPSWQLAQFVVLPSWLKFAGTHANVE